MERVKFGQYPCHILVTKRVQYFFGGTEMAIPIAAHKLNEKQRRVASVTVAPAPRSFLSLVLSAYEGSSKRQDPAPPARAERRVREGGRPSQRK